MNEGLNMQSLKVALVSQGTKIEEEIGILIDQS